MRCFHRRSISSVSRAAIVILVWSVGKVLPKSLLVRSRCPDPILLIVDILIVDIPIVLLSERGYYVTTEALRASSSLLGLTEVPFFNQQLAPCLLYSRLICSLNVIPAHLVGKPH